MTAVLAFLAGMAAGWLLNDSIGRITAAHPEVTMPQPPDTARPGRRPRTRGRARAWLTANHTRLVGGAAAAVAVAGLVLGGVNSAAVHSENRTLAAVAEHNAEVAACQTRFNAGVTQTLAIRARLNDGNTLSLLTFLSAVIGQPFAETTAERAAHHARDVELLAEFRRRVETFRESLADTKVPVLRNQCGHPQNVPPGS